MIIGIGNDIIDIRRLKKILDKHEKRFINRIFSQGEQLILKKKYKILSYAKRFCAKEAFSKALGTGISSGILWTDIQVFNKLSGMPYIKIKGKAKQILYNIIPKNYNPIIHLTISDDYPLAQSFVIIEAIPTYNK